MIPFGKDTITLIKRVETAEDGKTRTEYKRFVLRGCSWRSKAGWSQFDTEKHRNTEITCRIPSDQQRPDAGDYLFLGEIADKITDTRSLQAAIKAHAHTGVMEITSMSDNARPGMPLPHYAAWGG